MRERITYRELKMLMAKASMLGNTELGYKEVEKLMRSLKEFHPESKDYDIEERDVRDGTVEFTIISKNYGRVVPYKYCKDFSIMDARKVRAYIKTYRHKVLLALNNKTDLTYDSCTSITVAECSGMIEMKRKDGKFYTLWGLREEVVPWSHSVRNINDIITGLENIKEIAANELICNKRRKSIRKISECYGMSMILVRDINS